MMIIDHDNGDDDDAKEQASSPGNLKMFSFYFSPYIRHIFEKFIQHFKFSFSIKLNKL